MIICDKLQSRKAHLLIDVISPGKTISFKLAQSSKAPIISINYQTNCLTKDYHFVK